MPSSSGQSVSFHVRRFGHTASDPSRTTQGAPLNGSDHEPDHVPAVAPDVALDQMRDATGRLRDQGWMIAPLTNGGLVDPLPEGDPARSTNEA